MVYDLVIKRRKKYDISEYIWEIIVKLSEEDLFNNIDKIQLYNFLYSNMYKLPSDITKDELYRRIRKIMAIEAMSKIFDGYPEELKLFKKGENDGIYVRCWHYWCYTT